MIQEVLTGHAPVNFYTDHHRAGILDRPYDAKTTFGIKALHIHLLGDFLLVADGTPVTSIDVPRLQSLLAYLVLHRMVPQPRTQLAYLLWPDSSEAQAHTNLRNLLHKLRQLLPHADAFLAVERQTLTWHPAVPWTLDVVDFEWALTRAEHAEQAGDTASERQALEEAVQLYRGDLLPGCYDEWLLAERDRLQQRYLGALERLLVVLEQEGNTQAAIGVAHQLLRRDPLHEAAYRHLMRLYVTSGNRAAAVRTYAACTTVLERELRTIPSAATRAVYEGFVMMEGSRTAPQVAHPGVHLPTASRKHATRHYGNTTYATLRVGT